MRTKVSAWWLIFTSLAGLLFGPGLLWSYKNAQVERARLGIEKAKVIIEFRAKMNELLIDIGRFQADGALRQQHYQEYRAKIDNYNTLERNLATVEDRHAAEVNFEAMIPAPPSGLKLTIE